MLFIVGLAFFSYLSAVCAVYVYEYIFIVFSCDTLIAIWNIMIFIIDSLALSIVCTEDFAWKSLIRSVWE